MISKEAFCSIIRSLQNSCECADEIEETFMSKLKEKKKDDFIYYGTFSSMFCDYKLQDTIINILEKELNDIDGDISYFIFELNWGKKWTNTSIIYNGNSIDISTPEKLYDYLTENNNEINNKINSIKVVEPHKITIEDVEELIKKYKETNK